MRMHSLKIGRGDFMNDYKLVLQEFDELNEQVHAGTVYRDRWETFIVYLRKIGYPGMAKMLERDLERLNSLISDLDLIQSVLKNCMMDV